jgi:hypothetical protein
MNIPMTRRVLAGVLLGCLAFSFTTPGAGAVQQPGKQVPPEVKEDEKGADEQYRRDAERLVSEIEVEVLVVDKWSKSPRIEKPLLYYGDPTRKNDRGSVWAWGKKGRPVAVLELYRGANERTKWASVICNTSGGKVRASRGDAPWWRANDSATELKDIPGAPAPAADAVQRQRQLKLLAAKFAGHEFWDPDNSRYELRRLDRPLHTYRDEDAGILDGALYALANGTNPEILLFVEARVDPTDKSKAAWQFAVGRLAHAELHLEYEGKEVFTAPRADRARLAAPDKPYWLTFIENKPDIRPEK